MGKQNREQARFCGHCGRPLRDLTKETESKLETGDKRIVSSAQEPEGVGWQGETVLPALHPRHLIDLFLHPRCFFSIPPTPGTKPYVFFVAWLYGICITLAGINLALSRMTSSLSEGHWVGGWLVFAGFLTVFIFLLMPREDWLLRLLLFLSVVVLVLPPYNGGIWHQTAMSWVGFWRSVVCLSTIHSILGWVILSEWYRYRLYWCGDENPDLEAARGVFLCSSLVVTAPTILAAILRTILFSSPVVAAQDASIFSHIVRVLLSLLLLWSVYVSYCGAMTTFRLNRGLALVWFAGLPIVFYVLVLLSHS
jgi:hypothetical protein